MRHRAALLLVPLALAGCATALRPAPPEAQALKAVWADRRAAYPQVRALADVQVLARGRENLWPTFTAVFAQSAPDRITISGFTELGQPLFAYAAGGGRYTFRTFDGSPPRAGTLDPPPKDRSLRLLGDLGHLLDGVLGPETGPAPLRIDRKGRWVVEGAGERLHLRTVDGRIRAISIERRHGADIDLAFDDFRDAGPLAAPYRVRVDLPGLGARVEIAVTDWVLDTAPAGEPAEAPPRGANGGAS